MLDPDFKRKSTDEQAQGVKNVLEIAIPQLTEKYMVQFKEHVNNDCAKFLSAVSLRIDKEVLRFRLDEAVVEAEKGAKKFFEQALDAKSIEKELLIP
jgi:hypothetical protein